MKKHGWNITDISKGDNVYKYLFGPVPSRRLGMSLGVDLIPHKVCSLNCVYCECGRTTNLTLQRKEYIKIEEVQKELHHFFINNPPPDYITFSGAGEPTLNCKIGQIITFIRKSWPEISLAVLTNGTLLHNEEVRRELLHADVVLPSLDAAVEKDFLKIDRPHQSLNINSYIKGLIDFRKEYRGKIWLEVFILPEYNNDKENLIRLKEAFIKISPDRIQINTLDRPGTVDNLQPATMEELNSIKNMWNMENVEIIAPPADRKNIQAYRTDNEAAILETISRRPCTLQDLQRILGIHMNEINKYLGVLEQDGKIKVTRQQRGVFYQLAHGIIDPDTKTG